jgi:hypothetical protein
LICCLICCLFLCRCFSLLPLLDLLPYLLPLSLLPLYLLL